MRLPYWIRLNWWQSSRLAAVIFCGLAAFALFACLIVFAGLERAGRLAGGSWVAYSAFPLLVVILIAGFARLQSTINLQSASPSSSRPTDKLKAVGKLTEERRQ